MAECALAAMVMREADAGCRGHSRTDSLAEVSRAAQLPGPRPAANYSCTAGYLLGERGYS